MNKKIKILMAALVLLMGSNVYALNWNDFRTAVQNDADLTLNLRDYLNSENTLTWTSDLIVGADKTFVGLKGAYAATLSGNNARQALSLENRILKFYDKVEFKNFYSQTYGGAISAVPISSFYYDNDQRVDIPGNASIDFSSSTINFANNRAINGGGAIFAVSKSNGESLTEKATLVINFTSSAVNFTNNTAASNPGSGGVYRYPPNAGGAIYAGGFDSYFGNFDYSADTQSNITFTNSVVNFTNNSVYPNVRGEYDGTSEGGAISGGKIKFINSVVTFSNNRSNYYGGAVSQSSINFTNSAVAFINNTTRELGGAIYLFEDNAEFIGGSVNFINNYAHYGAAIYSAGASIIIEDANFTGNTARDGGGAVLLNTASDYYTTPTAFSTMTIRAVNRDTVFSNNRASDKPNDIFVTAYALIFFDARAGRSIDLQGGIFAGEIFVYPENYLPRQIKIIKHRSSLRRI